MAEHMHPDADLILDLALGHLSGPDRDGVVAHVADCPDCRGELEALTGAVESTLAAVPRTEPSAGFSAAVLERLQTRGPMERAGLGLAGLGLVGSELASSGEESAGGSRRRMPTWVGVAAAAVLGLGLGSGLTFALVDGPGGAPTTQTPVASAGAVLRTDGGEQVGTVSRSWSQGEPVLVVDISAGEAGRSYLCRLALADGGTFDAGRWTLSPDRPNSWVIADPGAAGVELVTDAGKVWSSATL